MNKHSLVTVIVTTKNEEANIAKCLESIAKQSYKFKEIIVVDNDSTDATKRIAKEYTDIVFNKGPERSAQRNFGAQKAKGVYLLFVDADMSLAKNVIKDCVEVIEKKDVGGIIIPEVSVGKSWWAKAKGLERSFYVGNDDIEAARFYNKQIFLEVKGFNHKMISGEDWDLSQRIANKYKLGRISSFITHNEGSVTLIQLMKKKYYYGKNFSLYMQNNSKSTTINKQINIFERYSLFFKDHKKLLKNPVLSSSMFFMKSCEYAAGFMGYLKKSQ